MGNLQVGLDVIQADISYLKAKKIGVISNQTSIDSKGNSIVEIMLSHEIDLIRIFAPEHGFRGEADAGASIDNTIDTKTGLPIFSLYGKNKRYSSWIFFVTILVLLIALIEADL